MDHNVIYGYECTGIAYQATHTLYNIMSLFLGIYVTVEPFQVAPVELVDYLLGKLFKPKLPYFCYSYMLHDFPCG